MLLWTEKQRMNEKSSLQEAVYTIGLHDKASLGEDYNPSVNSVDMPPELLRNSPQGSHFALSLPCVRGGGTAKP